LLEKLQKVKSKYTLPVRNVELIKKIMCLKNYYAVLSKDKIREILRIESDDIIYDNVMSKDGYLFREGFLEELE
ncbi:hypothetical protein, partial [Caminibacter mediatlanticus]